MAIKLSITLDSSQAKQELDALKEKIKEVKKKSTGGSIRAEYYHKS